MPFLGDNGRAGVRAYKPRGAAVAILLWAWVAAQGVVARAEEDAFLARADVVPPVTSLELPAYAHMCDASGTEYVLVVATESQLRRQGWRYSMIEPATAPEEYLVAHPVRPGARAAAKGRFLIVYDDGRQWVVRATANDADPAQIYANRCSIAAGPGCLFPATGSRTGCFEAARVYPSDPKPLVCGGIDFDPRFCHASPMSSLRQIGVGMISTRAGRGRPGSAEKRFLINGFIGFTL
ncbi:MAG: hypothetical protein ACOYOU_15995 [Kiritimatiellia bacterium]